MKKKKYIRFLFGLGIFGMAALFIAIAPVQSWGVENVDCATAFTCPAPGQFLEDRSIDTDGDGFRDMFECCANSNYYYNDYHDPNEDPIQIPAGTFDVNTPDLFVVVTKGELPPDFVNANIDIGNVLEFTNFDSIGINVHEIDESLVGGVREEDRYLPCEPGVPCEPSAPCEPGVPCEPNPAFRRVSPGSYQRAVRVHLSGYTEVNVCPNDSAIDSNIKIGIANIGNTMHPNAGGTVYINQIKRKVECLYMQVYGFDFLLPDPPPGNPEHDDWVLKRAKAKGEIETYIKHSAAHEIFHNLHLKWYDLTKGKDRSAYNKFEDHYSDSEETIMAQRVRASAKNNVNLLIGTTFKTEDAADALDHMTEEMPPLEQ